MDSMPPLQDQCIHCQRQIYALSSPVPDWPGAGKEGGSHTPQHSLPYDADNRRHFLQERRPCHSTTYTGPGGDNVEFCGDPFVMTRVLNPNGAPRGLNPNSIPTINSVPPSASAQSAHLGYGMHPPDQTASSREMARIVPSQATHGGAGGDNVGFRGHPLIMTGLLDSTNGTTNSLPSRPMAVSSVFSPSALVEAAYLDSWMYPPGQTVRRELLHGVPSPQNFHVPPELPYRATEINSLNNAVVDEDLCDINEILFPPIANVAGPSTRQYGNPSQCPSSIKQASAPNAGVDYTYGGSILGHPHSAIRIHTRVS